MEYLKKLLTESMTHEYATSGIEPQFCIIPKLKKRLDTDKIIKDYSEIEELVNKTLGEAGYPLNEITNFKILDPQAFYKLRDSERLNTNSAFLLHGYGYQSVYGKWYNVFVKETPLIPAFFYTFHEIGHILLLTCKNSLKKKEIEEVFADAYAFCGLEKLNTLCGTNYDTDYTKSYLKNLKSEDNIDSILKGLVDQFPTMRSMCNFLLNSTDEEIYKKSGLLKEPTRWERVKNFLKEF